MGFQMDEVCKLSTTMESSSTLFEKVIPVKITKCGPEERHMELTVRFLMGVSKVHRSTKVLQVQLTNELDPFFFYSLEVNEDEFQSLKVEQCILVDFATFPYKFIELLEQCIASGCSDSPRFLSMLNVRTGDSTFSIVETNQFKHLSHLSLCFRQGNDTVIKSYLAARLAEYKLIDEKHTQAINLDLHDKLRRTLLSLEKALRDVDDLSSELAELKEKQNRSVSELKAEYTLEIAHEKEKVMQETAELKERLERERADLESRLRQQADVQHERATELDKQVRTLLDTKYKLDTKVTELRTKFVALEKDLDEKQQECERLRRENRNLDSEKHENAKQLNRHLIRLSALEQEVQDKGDLLSNLTMQLENQASHRSALEGSWKEAQAAADRAEERASVSASEINKCYQIIEKLQLELRSMKSKVKLKGQVTSQQDTLIQEKQGAIDKGLNEIATLQLEVNRLKLDNENLKKKSDDLQGKLEEAQELVKSNQQMIQWLNQQLTEAQLGKLGTSGAASRYMYRPPNGLSYSTSTGLASSRVGIDAPVTGTSLSSSNSIGGISNPSNTFLPQCPLSSTMPYSLTSTPYSQSIHMKSNSNSLSSGLPSTYTSSTRPCCVAKAAAVAATNPSTSTGCSKVQYRPSHLAKNSTAGNNSGSACSLQTDTCGPISWPDDTSSWISKIGLGSGVVLPKPQLSFADVRTGFSAHSGAKSTATSYSRSAPGIDSSQPRSPPQNHSHRSQSPQSPQFSKAQSPHSRPQSPGPQPSTRSQSPRPRSPVRQKSPQLPNGYSFSKAQVVSNSDIVLSNCK